MVADALLNSSFHIRTHSLNDPQFFGPAQESQYSRDLEPGSKNCSSSFPFVNANALYPLLQGQLNNSRFARIQAGQYDRGQWSFQGLYLQP